MRGFVNIGIRGGKGMRGTGNKALNNMLQDRGTSNKEEKDMAKESKKQTNTLNDVLKRLLPLTLLTQIKPIADGIQVLMGLAGLGVMKLIDLFKWLGGFFGVIGDVAGWFFGYAEKVWNWTLGGLGSVWDWFKSMVGNAWTWVSGGAKNVWDWFKDKLSSVVSWGSTSAKSLWKWIIDKLFPSGKSEEDITNVNKQEDTPTEQYFEHPNKGQGTYVPPAGQNVFNADQLRGITKSFSLPNNWDMNYKTGMLGIDTGVSTKVINFYGMTIPEIVDTIKVELANENRFRGIQ